MKKYFLFMLIAFFLFGCDKSQTDFENPDDFSGDSGTFIDQGDDHEYKWVKIGDQIWMAENLKATKYNDGSDIPKVTDNQNWLDQTTGAYCWYNNYEATGNTYGALYNWFAVNSGKLAPKGWHTATDDEWRVLENSLIVNGHNFDGSTNGNKIAKSLASKTNWNISTKIGTPGMDLPSNNSSGFSALSGGARSESKAEFIRMGNIGSWWTNTKESENSTYSFDRTIYNDDFDLSDFGSKMTAGLSVRCVKD